MQVGIAASTNNLATCHLLLQAAAPDHPGSRWTSLSPSKGCESAPADALHLFVQVTAQTCHALVD